MAVVAVGNRRAVVFLGTQRIARMLALPEGLYVLGVRDDFLRDGVSVLVGGDALQEQPDGACLPDLPLTMLDRTDLAMRATVAADWRDDGAVGLIVHCPDEMCSWSRGLGVRMPTLALIVDTVQQHLADAHAS